MRTLVPITTIAALLSLFVAGPTLAKHVTETTTFLGNSNNEADEGQGGQGATTESTTGPKGQVTINDNPDCNNCDNTPRDEPGRNK